MVSFSQLLQGYKVMYNLKWKLIKKIQGLGLKWALKPKSLGFKNQHPLSNPYYGKLHHLLSHLPLQTAFYKWPRVFPTQILLCTDNIILC